MSDKSEPILNLPLPPPPPTRQHGLSLEEIRAVVNDLVPFQKVAGARILELDGNHAVASLPDSSETLNHVGTQHAAALFLVAEAAAGTALAGALRERVARTVFVVRESRIAYRKKACGEIRAVAALPTVDARAKSGEPTGEQFETVVESLLYDAEGELVAEGSFTYHCRLLPE